MDRIHILGEAATLIYLSQKDHFQVEVPALKVKVTAPTRDAAIQIATATARRNKNGRPRGGRKR